MPKHFQLLVPCYSNALYTAAGDAPLSYLRLGSAFAATDAPSENLRGHEWIKSQLAAALHATTPTYFFKDDERYSQNEEKPNTSYYRYDGVTEVPATDPRPWTQELLTRGGWYEHTDGNRLSTTRGDMLEVVGGNYRLAVLGRVEGPAVGSNYGTSHWESSGGHNHQTTSTPGEVVEVKWSGDVEDGTWQATTVTNKANVINYYEGRQESHYFGPSRASYQGPGEGQSFDTEAPVLRSEIYAKTATSKTNSDKSTTTTTIDANGSQTSFKRAKTIESSSGAIVKMSNSFVGNAETRHAFDTRWEVSLGLAKFGISLGSDSNIVERFTGVKMGLDFRYLSVTLDASATASLKIGAGFALKVAKGDSFTVAISADIKLAMLLLAFFNKKTYRVFKKSAAASKNELAVDVNLAGVNFRGSV